MILVLIQALKKKKWLWWGGLENKGNEGLEVLGREWVYSQAGCTHEVPCHKVAFAFFLFLKPVVSQLLLIKCLLITLAIDRKKYWGTLSYY
jgi:hypothetical protein